MSSLNLFPYKMKKGQWTKTESLNESDIAVIIDVNKEIFWFWEGSHSTTRDRHNARQILGHLRKNYKTYRFGRINEEASEDVKEVLEVLQIHALARKKSEEKKKLKNIIFYSLNIITCGLVIIIIYLLSGIFSQSHPSFPYLSLNQNHFLFILGLSSILSLISFTLLVLSAIYMLLSRRLFLMIMNVIGCGLIFTAFFILRIWDVLLIFNIINDHILFQNDAIFLFVFNTDMFLFLYAMCCVSVSILGLMNITISRRIGKVLIW